MIYGEKGEREEEGDAGGTGEVGERDLGEDSTARDKREGGGGE